MASTVPGPLMALGKSGRIRTANGLLRFRAPGLVGEQPHGRGHRSVICRRQPGTGNQHGYAIGDLKAPEMRGLGVCPDRLPSGKAVALGPFPMNPMPVKAVGAFTHSRVVGTAMTPHPS